MDRTPNARITAKDRNALKGALRRAFVRSELRAAVIARTRVDHVDPARPRVTKWSRCELCQSLTPTYLINVDHIDPLIPIDSHFEDMSLDVVADRLWCDPSNLQGICEECHDLKTAAENEARKPYKKPRKPRPKKSLR